jgi:hypothetical protein
VTAATVVEARPLRALTLWQPWASAVAYLGKDIENRGHHRTYRGLVLIHAGLRVDSAALQHMPAGLDLPRKAVVAIARLTGMHTDCDGRCSPWAQAGPGVWHWQLTDVHALTRPVPAPGAQGLWIPGEDLRARVAAALPHAARTAHTTAALIGA